jgi:hypothetical protein
MRYYPSPLGGKGRSCQYARWCEMRSPSPTMTRRNEGLSIRPLVRDAMAPPQRQSRQGGAKDFPRIAALLSQDRRAESGGVPHPPDLQRAGANADARLNRARFGSANRRSHKGANSSGCRKAHASALTDVAGFGLARKPAAPIPTRQFPTVDGRACSRAAG